MIGLSRAKRVACLFLALSTCRATALPQRATLPQPSLTAQVFVTNESFITRRLELRVNDVVVLDTVVGPPLNATGAVLLDSVRFAPGDHRLLLVDHYRKQQFRLRLTARPGPLCIFISLMGPRTGFRAGNYGCGFA